MNPDDRSFLAQLLVVVLAVLILVGLFLLPLIARLMDTITTSLTLEGYVP